MAAVVRSRSYFIVALALAACVVLGFARTFYLRYWFDVPPITLLVIAHGVVLTAWVVLFVTQTRLISRQDYQTHMKLGVAGMALAVLVVVLGLATAVISAAATRPRPMGLNSAQFVLFPTSIIIVFGALIAVAFAYRRKPAIHKRLMMLAMITVLGPAVARLIALGGMAQHFLALQTAVAAAFVVACIVADWVRHRTVHPLYSIGGTLIVLSWPLRAWLARTPAWEAVGNWMASLN